MNFFGVEISDAQFDAALALPLSATAEEIEKALGFEPTAEMLSEIRDRAALRTPPASPVTPRS